MKESSVGSSVLRAANGLRGIAFRHAICFSGGRLRRGVCAERRRATLAGGELRPDLRPVPALCGSSLLRAARA
jgi:hypothetical protein